MRALIRWIAYASSAMILLGLASLEILAGSAYESRSTLIWQITMLGILVTGLSSVVLLALRERSGLVGLAAIALVIIWFMASFTVGGHGIIARATAADGTEMCVIETPGGETRQTGFYYRRPGQRWGWFYYEHEDSHWWVGRIHVNPGSTRAVLYRLFLPVAYFDIPTERFTILRWNRTLGPAQRWMPDGWTPENALKSPDAGDSPMEHGAPDNNPPDLTDFPAAQPRPSNPPTPRS